MFRVISRLQHHLNSLHVMCWLVDLGISHRRALLLALMWERVAHPILYYRIQKIDRE